jgi:hypothetical protein
MNPTATPPPACNAAPESLRHLGADLAALRALSLQMRRLAVSSEPDTLRAVLARRETLLRAVRARLDSLAPAAGSPFGAALDRAIAEIADIDREATATLQLRAAAIADELAKLRAGREWRTTCAT